MKIIEKWIRLGVKKKSKLEINCLEVEFSRFGEKALK